MLEQILKSIQSNLPGDLPGDVRRNVEATLRSNLEKLNLVSREELEIQQKILERTRERVKELEGKIQQLEQNLRSEE